MSDDPGSETGHAQALSLNGDHPYSFEAAVVREPNRTVVAPSGELDIATCEALERCLAPLLDGGEHVVVDLGGLVFIDVAGMRALLRCATLARGRGVRLSIALGNNRVRRLFELCQTLDEFDSVYDSLSAVPH